VTGATFAAYGARLLAPSLRPGQVVILDNLSAHKSGDACTATEAGGARLLCLLAYPPDFNPIELAFAKIKGHLRAAASRTAENPLAATGALAQLVGSLSFAVDPSCAVASPSHPG
jgi:transposase